MEVVADVNQADSNGAMPLFKAAESGHEAVARALMEAGVDVNQAKNDGATPLLGPPDDQLFSKVAFESSLLSKVAFESSLLSKVV